MSTSAHTTPRRTLFDFVILAVGLLVFALDQLTKHLVSQSLGPGAPQHSIEVVGTFLRFSYTTNSGAAFGMFPQGTAVFTAIAILAVPLLLFSRLLIDSDSPLIRFSLGLLLGGTLGNLADRLRLGYVVDFIDAGIGQLRWYSFNVADSAFVIGVAVLAVYMAFLAPDGERQDDSPRGDGVPLKQAGAVEDR